MDTLAKLVNKIKGGKLKDAGTLAAPKSFEIGEAISQNVSLGSGKSLKVQLGGSLEGSLSLINSDDDAERVNDPEGLLLKPTFADAEVQKLMQPQPLLPFDSDTAYLRYQLGVQAKISGATTIDMTGLNFASQAKWASCFYAPHDCSGDARGKTIGEAVLADIGLDLNSGNDESQSAIGKIRSLFDARGTDELPIGSALSFTASGNLKSSMSVDAADLVVGSMNYSGLFKEAIPVSYSGGFKFGASFEMGGDFFLGVAATGEDELTVVLRRATGRSIGVDGSVGLSAGIDFTESVKAINDFVGQLTGLPRARVESLLESVNELVESGVAGIDQFVADLGGGQLPDALSKLYDDLVDDLEGQVKDWIEAKSDAILEPMEALDRKLSAWQQKLASYAKQKLELSFGFQYNKLDQSADLLRFRCTRAAFKKLRGDLLLFKFDVDALHATAGVTFERFLNLNIEEASSVVGLNLRIGKFALKSSVKTSKRWAILKDRMQEDRVLRANFLGAKEYDNEGFGALGNYKLTIEAASARDSDPGFGAPVLKEMDYTFGVTTTFGQENLTREKFDTFLDTAAVCGAIRGLSYDSAASRLRSEGIRMTGKYTAVAGISVTKSAARAVIRFLSGKTGAGTPVADHAFFAEALALGMLRWDGMAGRENNAERRLAYFDTWLQILERDLVTRTEKQALLARLDALNFDPLRAKEKKELKHRASDANAGNLHVDYRSFARILRNKPSLLNKLESLRGSMAELSGYLENGETDTHFQKFEKIYDDFSRGWSFAYSSRWIAAMLHLAVERVNIDHPEEVEYTCRMEKGDRTIYLPRI